jgi:hypothetical protein
MLRRILFALAAIVALFVVFVAGGLFLANRGIRALDPVLPSVDEILAFDPAADLPVGISWLNTASQKMPRAAVLDPSQDPTPDAPYAMSHASSCSVVRWTDFHGRRGRIPSQRSPSANPSAALRRDRSGRSA